jgi:hypothetical protein
MCYYAFLENGVVTMASHEDQDVLPVDSMGVVEPFHDSRPNWDSVEIEKSALIVELSSRSGMKTADVHHKKGAVDNLDMRGIEHVQQDRVPLKRALMWAPLPIPECKNEKTREMRVRCNL